MPIDAALFSGSKCYFFHGGRYIRVTRGDTGAGSVDDGYPTSIARVWGWPDDFGRYGIDAALHSGSKTYFFAGGHYIRVTRGDTGAGSVDDGYPATIASWRWPDGFGRYGIDAALHSGSKTYFFAGNHYIRVTRGDTGAGSVDDGYPATIASWGWPDGFGRYGIDAALHSGSKTYFFAGNHYIRVTRGDTGAGSVDEGYPVSIARGWRWPEEFVSRLNGIDAALYSGSKCYFFDGGRYIRVTRGDTGAGSVDDGYPTSIARVWGWPDDFGKYGIDAALHSGSKTYFFAGGHYIRVTRGDTGAGSVDDGYPATIASWRWPDGFGKYGIDAALHSGSKTYFFAGGHYIRVTRGETGAGTVDDGYPRSIASGWGWPDGFGKYGIDAALHSGSKTYFFAGGHYIRVTRGDTGAGTVDEGYPVSIARGWGWPVRTSPIGWQPSVLRPVFYGERDISSSDGPPVALRVFFPSVDGSPRSAEILAARASYPLVVFLHGNCDQDEHYKLWTRLPRVLATCGYVVVVPDLPAIRTGTLPRNEEHPDVQRVLDTVAWLRSEWAHANLLASSRQTALVGHSRGALLAAFLQPKLSASAITSLSGAWTDILGLWDDLGVPIFYLWGTHTDDVLFALDGAWSSIPAPKRRGVFDNGAHWDYLRAGAATCENARGPCTLTEALAADLSALFAARHVPPASSDVAGPHPIPADLEPPDVELTDAQAFFAGGHHLASLDAVTRDHNCRVELGWDTGVRTGTRTLG